MLSFEKKEKILFKAGIDAPKFPSRRLPVEERFLFPNARVPHEQLEADQELAVAIAERRAVVEGLFVDFIAQRSARSLREAQETESLHRLRRMNISHLETVE